MSRKTTKIVINILQKNSNYERYLQNPDSLRVKRTKFVTDAHKLKTNLACASEINEVFINKIFILRRLELTHGNRKTAFLSVFYRLSMYRYFFYEKIGCSSDAPWFFTYKNTFPVNILSYKFSTKKLRIGS